MESTIVQSFNFIAYERKIFMKHNQGHWKWYEWVKMNNYYYHAKFDIYHIYSVRENQNFKVFATYGHSTSWPAWHW